MTVLTFEEWGEANELATDALMEETMTQSEMQEQVQPLAEVAMFDLTVALHALEDEVVAYLEMPGITAGPVLADIKEWQARLERIRVVVERKS